MDRNEVKSKLLNPIKGMLSTRSQRSRPKGILLTLGTETSYVPRGKEINRDSTSSGERT